MNQPWQQMRALMILLFGKTKAFFGKDTARKKKLCFCIRYLWKMKEKPANLNRGVCFSLKWKATCKNWAHLDKKKNQPKKSLTWFFHAALQLATLVNYTCKSFTKLAAGLNHQPPDLQDHHVQAHCNTSQMYKTNLTGQCLMTNCYFQL